MARYFLASIIHRSVLLVILSWRTTPALLLAPLLICAAANAQNIEVEDVRAFLSGHAVTLVPDYEMPVDVEELRSAHRDGLLEVAWFRPDGSLLGRDELGEPIFLPGQWRVMADGENVFVAVEGEVEMPQVLAVDSDRIVMSLPDDGEFYLYAVTEVDLDAEAGMVAHLTGNWEVRTVSDQSLQHMQPITYRLLPGGHLEIDVDESAPGDPIDTDALLPVGRWTTSATSWRVEVDGEVFEGPLLILYDDVEGGIPFVIYDLGDDHMAIGPASFYSLPLWMELVRSP